MSEHLIPLVYTLLFWWISTGVILYLDGLPQRSFRWSMLGASLLLLLSLYGFVWSSSTTSLAGAYIAFSCSLVIWGWHEMSFLMGYITGPRRTACPEHCAGWRRFIYAAQTVIHHELALFATAIALIWLAWDAPNQIGLWAFLVLWLMRLSAKLNIFLGAPNLSEEFLPKQLHYLESYFKRAPMNLLFPISITLSTLAAVMLVQRAIGAEASLFEAAGYSLVATLLALAILEHWFLVLPLPATALWRWGLRSHNGAAAVEPRSTHGVGGARTNGSDRAPDRRLLVKSEALSAQSKERKIKSTSAAAIRI